MNDMKQNEQAGLGHAIAFGAFKLVTDPVLFVTLGAPTAIGKAMSWAQLLLGQTEDRRLDGIADVLGSPAFPGVLDYTLQTFVAFLGATFLIFRMAESVLGSWSSQERAHSEAVLRAYSALLIIAVVGWIWFFFVDGVNSAELIEVYVDNAGGLGEYAWPPLNASVTWVRGLVVMIGGLMTAAENGWLSTSRGAKE